MRKLEDVKDLINRMHFEDRNSCAQLLSITIMNNEIPLMYKCNCKNSPDCYSCFGKGFYLSDQGHQLKQFVEACKILDSLEEIE